MKIRFSYEDNYANNRAKMPKALAGSSGYSPLTEDGYIGDQRKLSDIKYGAYTSDRNGCGWIAVWNLIKSTGALPPKEKVVYEAEKYLPFGGAFGTEVFSVRKYLKSLGFKVKMYFSKRKAISAAMDRGIVYYVRKRIKSAHYVAFEKVGEDEQGKALYKFYNEGGSAGTYWAYGKGGLKYTVPPVCTLEEYFKRINALLYVLYDVKVPETKINEGDVSYPQS